MSMIVSTVENASLIWILFYNCVLNLVRLSSSKNIFWLVSHRMWCQMRSKIIMSVWIKRQIQCNNMSHHHHRSQTIPYSNHMSQGRKLTARMNWFNTKQRKMNAHCEWQICKRTDVSIYRVLQHVWWLIHWVQCFHAILYSVLRLTAQPISIVKCGCRQSYLNLGSNHCATYQPTIFPLITRGSPYLARAVVASRRSSPLDSVPSP